MQADPGQQRDVADQHPETVRQLRADYEAWWKSLEPAMLKSWLKSPGPARVEHGAYYVQVRCLHPV